MLLIVVSVLAPSALSAQSYNIKDLGALLGTNSYAHGINNQGQVVGYWISTNGARAFLYSAGTVTDLGSLGGTNNYALSINSSGQVVGFADDTNGISAFLYRNGTITNLGSLGGLNSYAYGINDGGQVVGYLDTTNGSRAFLYLNNSVTNLGTLGGTNSFAFGINNSNLVVGSSLTETEATHAFLWQDGILTNLNQLIDSQSGWVLNDARGINNTGKIVGWGVTNGQEQAFLFVDGVIYGIGLLPGGTNSFAYGINNSNRVVGASMITNGILQAFLWSDSHMTNLNELLPPDSTWDLREARGINDSGSIVGWGLINGQEHAFILSSNTPPLVSLTNPANNVLLSGPTTISLNASASDSDGTVEKVEFYDGTTKLGEDIAEPFLLDLDNVSEGLYAFTAVAIDDAGARSTSSVVNVTVALPPSIAIQPQSLQIMTGSNATFTVTASGTVPLSYQWKFNGNNISGATHSSYTIANVQTVHSGNYSVQITNLLGSVTSDNASLTVTVNPFNMGKGDWIYYVSMATNKLGGNVTSVTDIPSLMNYERLQGMQFIVVKAGDGGTIWPQFNAELVNAAHAAGLKIFGYGRVFGTNITGEIAVATNVLALGADGFVIDAEIEYESQNLANNTAAAESYCQGIRAVYPNAFLAHSPFALISYHATFPYVTFGTYCDVVMPQCYWKSFGISPSNMVHQLDTQWRNWQNSLTGSATNAIKPIVPIAQAWSPSVTNVTTGAEIAEFVNRLKTNGNPASVGGYKGVSFWRADLHTPDMWSGIGNSSIGNPTGAPLILTQPESYTVNAGDSVTFDVEAIGTGTLDYQWRRNGLNISGATESSYTRTNVQASDVGVYTVIVSNLVGTVLSSDALLSMQSYSLWTETFETGLGNWTTIASALTNSSAQNHTPSGTNAAKVGASGNRMYRNLGVDVDGYSKITFWIYDSTQTRAYGEVRAYSGTGYGSGSLQQIFAIGRYGVGFGTGTGDLASEVVDANKYQGRVYSGSNAGWFNLNLSGAPNRSTGWHKFEIERLANGTTINFYVDGVLGRTITSATAAKWDAVTIGSVAVGTTAGDAWFDDINSEYFGVPVILTQPVSQTVNAGATVVFAVTATNNVTSYQWRKNGVNISGATSSSLILPYVGGSSSGEYTVIVGNGVGSVVSQVATLAVIVPPTIVAQPANQTVTSGTDVSFRVVVNGTAPFTYQWRKNGVNLSDAGNIAGSGSDELILNDVSQLDAGGYSVVVANQAGTVTSSAGMLSLNGSVIFTEDFESGTLNNWTTVPSGNALEISASIMNPVSGTKTGYLDNSLDKMYHNLGTEVSGRARATYWIYDDGGTLTRSFGEMRAFSGSGYNDGSLQQVLAVGNYKTPFDSNTGTLNGETMNASKYQGRVVGGVNTGWFNLNAPGTQHRSAGWHKFEIVRSSDGSAIHFYVDGILGRTIPEAFGATWDSVALGSYGAGAGLDVGEGWFDDVKVENLDQVIVNQPISQTKNQGESVTFTVNATGNNLSYQWKKNGFNITGATASSFTLNNVQPSDEADYSVLVSTDTDAEPSTLAGLIVIVPPSITTQPTSQTKNQGQTATFIVVASGTGPSYLWHKNGGPMSDGGNVLGVTTATLQIINVAPADEGSYTVELSNSAGTVTSSAANLSVIVPPTIITQPANQTKDLGGSASFTVVATGTMPLSYQWQRNSSPISGATDATLTLLNLTLADAGNYTVVVGNAAGNEASIAAVCTVNNQVATPTFSRPSGQYPAIGGVTVTCVTSGAVIHYTTNGNEPTESDPTIGSGAFLPVRWSQTVKARAWKPDWITSPIQAATYTLTGAITAGDLHGMVLRDDGTVVTWGGNNKGQLGDNSTTSRLNPDLVNLPDVVAIGAGQYHSLAVKRDGTVWGWGWNANRELGDESTMDRWLPIRITTVGCDGPPPCFSDPLVGAKEVASQSIHSLVLLSSGYIAAWGNNTYGQLGLGDTFGRSTPRYIDNIGLSKAIAAGRRHSIALGVGGEVTAWGDNAHWQVSSTISASPTPSPFHIIALQNVVSVSAGEMYSTVLKSDGTIWSWGGNASGQMGNGAPASTRSVLVKAIGGSYKGVKAGSAHTLALKQNGTVMAWGSNGSGQLGNGSQTSSSVPIAVAGLENIILIAAKKSTSYAVQDNGAVWAWGANETGQFGDGTTEGSSVPKLTALRTTNVDDRDCDGVPTWTEIEDGSDPENASSMASTRLGFWKFNDTAWSGEEGQRPNAVANVQAVSGIEGNALMVDSANSAKLSYRETRFDGSANINLRRGTLRFWFKPNWNGGIGTGSKGRLIDSGSSLSNQGRWSLAFDETASQLTFSSGLNGASVPYLTDDISDWSSSEWYHIALTYSDDLSEGTKLYVNGFLKQSGGPVQYWPSAGEFRIGSNENGLEQAKGIFESLETFNYPLTAPEISSTYDPAQMRTRMPIIDPPSGHYSYAPSIRVIAADAGDIVRYRTDGKEPTVNDPVIQSGEQIPIWITEDTTITAKAWRSGKKPSVTVNGTYTLSVGTPGLSPSSGVYAGNVYVNIGVATPNATIRYTLDGSEPTATSVIFNPNVPIHLTSTTTVKAKAWKGSSSSAVISALYTIRDGPVNDNVANSEVVSGTHGVVYSTSLGATTEPFEGCLDGDGYHDSSVWFEWTPSSDQRITFMADGEDYIDYYLHVISGTVGSCINDLTVATGNKSVSFDAITGTTYRIAVYKDQYSWQRPFVFRWFSGTAVTDPIISPGSGTYHSSQFVYVTCDTPGSLVRYTFDGSEPTESSLLLGTGRLSISKSQVLKVKAWSPGLVPSATVIATYVIDHNALTTTQVVLPPVPTPSSCAFDSSLDVTAGSITSGATIRYTLDGSEPTASNPELISQITLSSSARVKFKAFKAGMEPSATVSVIYAKRNIDTDFDGIPDDWELAHGSDPLRSDAYEQSLEPFAHGLTHWQVYQNPTVLQGENHSSAGDGIADWWKVKYGYSTSDLNLGSAIGSNGLSLEESYENGYNPNDEYDHPNAMRPVMFRVVPGFERRGYVIIDSAPADTQKFRLMCAAYIFTDPPTAELQNGIAVKEVTAFEKNGARVLEVPTSWLEPGAEGATPPEQLRFWVQAVDSQGRVSPAFEYHWGFRYDNYLFEGGYFPLPVSAFGVFSQSELIAKAAHNKVALKARIRWADTRSPNEWMKSIAYRHFNDYVEYDGWYAAFPVPNDNPDFIRFDGLYSSGCSGLDPVCSSYRTDYDDYPYSRRVLTDVLNKQPNPNPYVNCDMFQLKSDAFNYFGLKYLGVKLQFGELVCGTDQFTPSGDPDLVLRPSAPFITLPEEESNRIYQEVEQPTLRTIGFHIGPLSYYPYSLDYPASSTMPEGELGTESTTLHEIAYSGNWGSWVKWTKQYIAWSKEEIYRPNSESPVPNRHGFVQQFFYKALMCDPLTGDVPRTTEDNLGGKKKIDFATAKETGFLSPDGYFTATEKGKVILTTLPDENGYYAECVVQVDQLDIVTRQGGNDEEERAPDVVYSSDPAPEVDLQVESATVNGSGQLVVRVIGTVKDKLSELADDPTERVQELKFKLNNGLVRTISDLPSLNTASPALPWSPNGFEIPFDETFTIDNPGDKVFILTAVTSENGAGNAGWDKVAIGCINRFTPSTLTTEPVSIKFSQAPTSSSIDTLQVFFGDRDAVVGDPTFTETSENSMLFNGTLMVDGQSCIANLQLQIATALDAGAVDYVDGILTYTVPGQDDRTIVGGWIETAANSLRVVNNAVFANGGITTSEVSYADELEGSEEGAFDPYLVRTDVEREQIEAAERVVAMVNEVEYSMVPFTFSPERHYLVTQSDEEHAKPQILVITAKSLPPGLSAITLPNLKFDSSGRSTRIQIVHGNSMIEDAQLTYFENDFGRLDEESDEFVGPVTMPVLLTYYRMLFGQPDSDLGMRLLAYYQAGGNLISLGDVIGDFDVEYVLRTDGKIRIEIEEDTDPVNAAMLLFSALQKAIDYRPFKHQIPDSDLEAYLTQQYAIKQNALAVGKAAGEAYLAGLSVINEGVDIAVTISDVVEADGAQAKASAAVGFLPFVPSGARWLWKKADGTIVATFTHDVVARITTAFGKPNRLERIRELRKAMDEGLVTEAMMKQFIDAGFIRKYSHSYNAKLLGKHIDATNPQEGFRKVDFTNPQAHHDLPFKYIEEFMAKGMDINDPEYGRWVSGTPPGSHQNWTHAFNAEWEQFFTSFPNPSVAMIETKMNTMRNSGRYPSR